MGFPRIPRRQAESPDPDGDGAATAPSADERPRDDDALGSKPRRASAVSLLNDHAYTIGLLGGLGVLTAIVIGEALSHSLLILTYVGAALFLAVGVEPVVRKLEALRFPRPLAIITVFVVVVGAITGVLVLIIPTAISEGQVLATQAPAFLNDVQHSGWFEWINDKFQGSADDIIAGIMSFLRDPQQWMNIAGGVFSVSAGIASGVLGFFTVTVLMLYFMASLGSILRASSLLLPASRRARYMDIISRVRDNVGNYMVSQIIVALINAVCAYIAMSIIGVRFAVVLAPVIFFLALIPLIGSICCTILSSLVALLGGVPSAIAMLVYYLIYMQIEAYVLTPRIMRRNMPVPGIAVIIAALLGGALMGVLGALIAIPLAASVIMLVKELWIPRQDQR